MIKKLLEKLNEKAKANDCIVEITCNVSTSQFLRLFNEKYQEDFKEYKNRLHNIIVFDAKLGEEEGENMLFFSFVMRFDFYTYEDYFSERLESPRMTTKIEFNDFTEFHKKLSFLVNNLKK